MDQTLPAYHVNYRKSTENPEQNTWQQLVAPPLKTYPSVVKDAKYTQPFRGTGITGHGMFISSKCKEPDRAWRVIEGFACDELYERIFWGWEGETYTVENGKRIPKTEVLSNVEKHRYGAAHATIFGFNNAQDVAETGAAIGLGDEYFNKIRSHIEVTDKMARTNGVSPFAFVKNSDEANKKSAEANDEVFAISTEYVMSKINSEQYDQRVAEWIKKYGFIAEEQTKYINEHKEEFKSKGVRFDR